MKNYFLSPNWRSLEWVAAIFYWLGILFFFVVLRLRLLVPAFLF